VKLSTGKKLGLMGRRGGRVPVIWGCQKDLKRVQSREGKGQRFKEKKRGESEVEALKKIISRGTRVGTGTYTSRRNGERKVRLGGELWALRLQKRRLSKECGRREMPWRILLSRAWKERRRRMRRVAETHNTVKAIRSWERRIVRRIGRKRRSI